MTTDGRLAAAPPSPTPDADSAFYWEGLRQRRILMQQCASCSRTRFPAMPSCPYCASREWELVEVKGAGSIYSWIVVHRAFDPAFATEVPYVIATVDVDEGPRVAVRIDGAEGLTFGSRVRPVFVDHGEWTELRMTPDGRTRS